MKVRAESSVDSVAEEAARDGTSVVRTRAGPEDDGGVTSRPHREEKQQQNQTRALEQDVGFFRRRIKREGLGEQCAAEPADDESVRDLEPTGVAALARLLTE